MLRLLLCLILVSFLPACSKSPVEPLTPTETPVVLDETATEREIRLALATPEGKAIDQWLTAQGFERCPADQAIARTDGTDKALDVPYWNAILKEKGVLTQTRSAVTVVTGAVKIRPDPDFGMDGSIYVWDPALNGVREVLRPADFAPAPCRPGGLSPQKRFRIAFREWEDVTSVVWARQRSRASLPPPHTDAASRRVLEAQPSRAP